MYKPIPLKQLLQPNRHSFDDDMAAMHDRGMRGVWASSYHGFNPADMARLPAYRFEGLHAQDGGPTAVAPIEAMPWLRSLTVGGAGLPLDLSRHESLEALRLHWHPKLRLPLTLPALRHLTVWKYKPTTKDLKDLPAMPELEHLELIQWSITSLSGIARFPSLTDLELHYNPALQDVSEISTLRNLREIRIAKCPNVVDLAALSACTEARVVWIDGVREIPSITFARSMPHLERLGVKKCNVLDGDLSPGDRIPNFYHDNRPHYNRKKQREPPLEIRGPAQVSYHWIEGGVMGRELTPEEFEANKHTFHTKTFEQYMAEQAACPSAPPDRK